MPARSRALKFLDGGGITGELMRTHDWAESPLGYPFTWPQSLRSVVGLLLQSQFPMFVAWGRDLNFLYNDPYAEVLGSKHPSALGRRFCDIWAEIWSDISPLIDAAMAGQATYREDLPLLMNRKGYDEQTWFTFSYSPVRDESGQVAGMFCACTETTGRVLAERNLRESERRLGGFVTALRELNETLERRVTEALAERKLLADIVEGTNAFVQVVDLEYRWLAINRAAADEFERIFGRRPHVGDCMLDLLETHIDDQTAIRAVWDRALAGEEFTHTEQFGDPVRDRRTYEMRFNSLRDRNGQVVGAYQFVYDVTERLQDHERLKKAENALRHAQQLESLGQLTGGVAHDFNNLLAVFANGLQLLERKNVGEAQRQRVFEGMRRAVARGSGLTHHLLAFTRRRPFNSASINLSAQLDGMHEILERSLGGDVHVEMKIDPHLWPVEVDVGEFELAMLNLCVNARDAMVGGSTICVTAKNRRIAAEPGVLGEFVELTVEDTGSGMSPEVLARVFEPFFTTKESGKGSGLGLPQVYGFAQQSGGKLSLESTVGIGTTVTLQLPRSSQAPSETSLPGTTHSSIRSGDDCGMILLVEDDNEVAALTREMLSALGFTVVHAASPAAALGALADGRPIDFVLSDIMMPGDMNGLELAREIRRRKPCLPIVLTTGYAEAASGMKPKEFELLLKPYTIEALSGALKVKAERERQLDEAALT